MNSDFYKNQRLLFHFSQELFSNYHTLQVYSELVKSFKHISEKYNLTIPINNTNNIRSLYNKMINNFYHNEITIKSNFINNVLLKSNNHVTIFELSLYTSRVDLCKFSTKSTAFEIKTDLDNLYRLQKQIDDYSKIFEEVYVICSLEKLSSIFHIIPSYCGIYTYHVTKDFQYKFTRKRKAITSTYLNNLYQLKLLSKPELVNNFSKISHNNDKNIMIENIINSYSYKYINSTFKKIIKNKYKSNWQFIKENHNKIYEIDYQWFFKNNIDPNIIYQ